MPVRRGFCGADQTPPQEKLGIFGTTPRSHALLMLRREHDDHEDELEQIHASAEHISEIGDTVLDRVHGIKPGEAEGFCTPTCHFCDVRGLPEGLAKPQLTRLAKSEPAPDAGADAAEPPSAQVAQLGMGSAFFSASMPRVVVEGPDAQ